MSSGGYRLLAEENGKRFYLRDGSVTAVAMEIRAKEIVAPASLEGLALRRVAAAAIEELREVESLAGHEVVDDAARVSTSKPMPSVDAEGEDAGPVWIVTVEIGVWPKPGA